MIWLIGSKSLLGSEIAKQLTQHKIPWIGTNSDVDITNYQELEAFEKTLETSAYYPSQLSHAQRKVQWIINCTEYSDIESAEENIEKCNTINITGAQNIARLCRNIGCKLIQLSTNNVFDGSKQSSFSEDDSVSPLNVYGKSKHQAEVEISRLMNTYYIIRTSWLYGSADSNFILDMIDSMNSHAEFIYPDDMKASPTNALDLTDAILKLIEKSESATSLFGKNSAPNYGIYNFTNSGEATLFDIAQIVYKYGKKYGKITNECKINPCSSSDTGLKAVYPSYSVLNNDKISKAIKIKVPNWESSLEKFLKNL